MTTTIHTKTASRRRGVRALVAAGVVAGALPLLAASPANAVSSSGCTATPSRPYVVGLDSGGSKIVRYDVNVACLGNRTMVLRQEVREEDTFSDDSVASRYQYAYFDQGGSRTFSWDVKLPNTEWGDEEVYQRVRFYVSSGGVNSPWTGWHKSSVRQIAN